MLVFYLIKTKHIHYDLHRAVKEDEKTKEKLECFSSPKFELTFGSLVVELIIEFLWLLNDFSSNTIGNLQVRLEYIHPNLSILCSRKIILARDDFT